jgi:hypothetical protein
MQLAKYLEILHATTFTFFRKQLKHEAIMSIILETTTVKETLFSDFKGEIKAWAPGA